MNQHSLLEYYTTAGPMTEVGDNLDLLQGLPVNVADLREVVQGVLAHVFWAERYGLKLSEEQQKEPGIRTVAGMLARIRELDNQPLRSPRPLAKRLVHNCRGYSLLLVTLLRLQGIPARARCGFGAYFVPGHFEDHWVCEYWSQDDERWVLVDAQLDPLQIRQLQVTFNPLDVPRDQFIVAGKAWQLARTGQQDPDNFGIFDMHGLWFIRGNVMRDFWSLNKVEVLPWDVAGLAAKKEEEVTAEDLALLDEVAALTLGGDEAFAEVRARFENDTRVGIPAGWPEG